MTLWDVGSVGTVAYVLPWSCCFSASTPLHGSLGVRTCGSLGGHLVILQVQGSGGRGRLGLDDLGLEVPLFTLLLKHKIVLWMLRFPGGPTS